MVWPIDAQCALQKEKIINMGGEATRDVAKVARGCSGSRRSHF